MSRLPHVRSTIAVAIAALLVGAATAWALFTVLAPRTDVLAADHFTLIEVTEQEVGATQQLSATAVWAARPVAANLAAGTVTSVGIENGQEVAASTVLYSVDLRPTVIAEGSIPAFQTLSAGSTGPDVAQLQTLLQTVGLYSGPADGEFGAGTEYAVLRWQEQLGVTEDGVVQPGDIVFVPGLPARISLDTKAIARGLQVSGGELAILALPAQPAFEMALTDGQQEMIPVGTRVELRAPERRWEAVVVETRNASDESEAVAVLGGVDGATICGDDCGALPADQITRLGATVYMVEPQTGAAVPTAAILTKPDGSTVVLDEQGRELEVSIVTSARGIAIVEGAASGLLVRVPAEQDDG